MRIYMNKPALSLTRAPTRHAARPSHARQRMQLQSSIGVRNSNTARCCEVCLLRRQKGTGPHSRDSRRQWLANVAELDADLELFWRGASGGRRWPFFLRRLQHAQLEVLPELAKAMAASRAVSKSCVRCFFCGVTPWNWSLRRPCLPRTPT